MHIFHPYNLLQWAKMRLGSYPSDPLFSSLGPHALEHTEQGRTTRVGGVTCHGVSCSLSRPSLQQALKKAISTLVVILLGFRLITTPFYGKIINNFPLLVTLPHTPGYGGGTRDTTLQTPDTNSKG